MANSERQTMSHGTSMTSNRPGRERDPPTKEKHRIPRAIREQSLASEPPVGKSDIYYSQQNPNQYHKSNQPFTWSSAYNCQDLPNPSTSQERSYETTMARHRPQMDRDPRKLQKHYGNLVNTHQEQEEHSLASESFPGRSSMIYARQNISQNMEKRATEVNVTSIEGCRSIILDDDPIALFGDYYQQSDWYKSLKAGPSSIYADLTRQLLTDYKSAPETEKVVIPAGCKSMFDDDNSNTLFSRYLDDSSEIPLSVNGQDVQQFSKSRLLQQKCYSGGTRKYNQKLSQKCPNYKKMPFDPGCLSLSEEQQKEQSNTIHADMNKNPPPLESSEDQGINSSELLSSIEQVGENLNLPDIWKPENTLKEIIKTETFLEEEFDPQATTIKEEPSWW